MSKSPIIELITLEYMALHQIILFQWVLIIVSAGKIPPYVTVCSRNNPKLGECIRDSANLLVPYLRKGIPEMDLPPLDPFVIPLILMEPNGSIVKSNFEVTDCKVFNASNYNINHMDAYLHNVTIFANISIPYLDTKGNYRLQGRVLTFVIEGQGAFDFESEDVLADVELHGEEFTKNDKTYLKLNEIKTSLQIKKIKLYFYNLFGNNQVLTDTVNTIINENVQELKADLDNVISKAISDTVLAYFKRVLNLFTKDELFPEE